LDDDTGDHWELRPWQGVNLTWPREPFLLEHYVRMEERFDFETASWNVRRSLRTRYRVGTFVQWATPQNGTHWRIMGSLEGFVTTAGDRDRLPTQLRFSFGLECGFQAGLRVQFEAAWQLRDRPLAEGTADELFLRLRFFQR
jgi:hypothetical protein